MKSRSISRPQGSKTARGTSKSVGAGKSGKTRASLARTKVHLTDPTLPSRAEKLLRREIAFIHNRSFSRMDVEKAKAEFQSMSPNGAGRTRQAPADVPAYFQELYATPLLTADEEKALFRLMNLFKFRANALRSEINPDSPAPGLVSEAEGWISLAGQVRDRIVRANLRLVVSIARRFANDLCSFDDLVSDGNVALLNAVEKFDYGRGFRFSTYATHAVQRDFFRIIRKRRNESARCTLGISEMLANSPDDSDPVSIETDKLRQASQVRELMSQQLSEREQLVVALRFGLQPGSEPATLQVVADALQVSKERVRQIELKAIEKMQRGATITRWQTAG
ncbi:MAG: sigma-70 family RNA polymerase sigma factor [Planctomycetaceae bacterium]|jgi:RNA polymerase primary sigma factor